MRSLFGGGAALGWREQEVRGVAEKGLGHYVTPFLENTDRNGGSGSSVRSVGPNLR